LGPAPLHAARYDLFLAVEKDHEAAGVEEVIGDRRNYACGPVPFCLGVRDPDTLAYLDSPLVTTAPGSGEEGFIPCVGGEGS
jgi:hypothetical protein